jgi:microcystin-dependent protein
MSDPFVAEIRMFGFNFAPTGWATCDGQLLPISQNTALFSLLGTFYGGDGKSTFALPNLSGSVPMHQGTGAGLSQRFLGEQSGTNNITLLITEMPVHAHPLTAHSNIDPANNLTPSPVVSLGKANPVSPGGYAPPGNIVQMNQQALTPNGGGLPHNNMQPYLAVTFCIAMQGVFPPRQ